jgi:hypothetical protein
MRTHHTQGARKTSITATLALVVLGLGMAALAAPRATKQDKLAKPDVKVVVSGVQLRADPKTGDIRPPTREESLALGAALHQQFARSSRPMQVIQAENGAVAMELSEDYMETAILRASPDGAPSIDCVSASEAARIMNEESIRAADPIDMSWYDTAVGRVAASRAGSFAIAQGAGSNRIAGGATVTVINTDGAGEGFNDATPAAPIGGNPGVTIGQQRLIAFQAAANLWGSTLDSNVQITVDAQFNALACNATQAVLGSAGSIFIYANFAGIGFWPGAEFANTWYPSALAKKRAGFDIAPANMDIRARFNSNLGNVGCLTGIGWYYGLDGNHGTQIDLMAVLLHELGHGMGFQQFASLTTGAQQLGFTDVYGRRLLDTTTGKTWNQMTNAERVASAVNFFHVVWSGPEVTAQVPNVLSFGVPLLHISAPAGLAGNYAVGAAQFGPPLSAPGVTGNVVLVNDGVGTTSDGCEGLAAGSMTGKIALIDRGSCSFIFKAKNAQDAGAIGVIIANNVAGSPPPGLGGVDPTITIPTASVSQGDGNLIKTALLGGPVTATLGVDMAVRAGADAAGRAMVFAPNPVQGGSSISHWDPIAFRNQLMEPFINGDLTHSLQPPEDLTLPLMRDIGWFPDANLNGIADDNECVIACPDDAEIGTDAGRCDAVFTYNISSTGICGTMTGSPASGSIFPLGTTTVTISSETGIGTCSFDVTVVDDDAPSITGQAATPATLWPPDHAMRDVTISYNVADNCPDGNCVLSVTSNEPQNGTGDGDTAPDWQVIDAHNVQLRAERAGTGTGRGYTVTIACTDGAGNQTSKSVVVGVPFDQRRSRNGGIASEGSTSPTIDAPRELTLGLQGPNPPVGGATTIRYGLPSSGQVELSIYDAAGRRVGTLVQGTVDAGWHTATWDPNVAAGVYFARMTVNGKTLTHRLVMLR